MIARFLGWNQLSRGLITGFHVAYMLVETRYGRVDRQVFVPNVQSCGVSDMAVAVEEGGETFSWFKYKKQVRFSSWKQQQWTLEMRCQCSLKQILFYSNAY